MKVAWKLLAASAEMGCDVDAERVELARERYAFGPFATVDEMRQRLTDALGAFERAGGRGVDLAEEIDDLRILLAVEPHRELDEDDSTYQVLAAPGSSCGTCGSPARLRGFGDAVR